MGLTITASRFYRLNEQYYGNSISQTPPVENAQSQNQPSEAPKKKGSGLFSGCSRRRIDRAEKAYKKYEGQVARALRSVIQINQDISLDAGDSLNLKDKKLQARIIKATKEVEALPKKGRSHIERPEKGGRI